MYMKISFACRGLAYRCLLCLVLCLAASCGNELPAPDDGHREVNENANVSPVAAAMRLEIPHLKGGTHNQFLVKTARLRDSGSSRTFVNFCMEYDWQLRASRWTAFRWDIDNVYDCNCGRAGNFTPDMEIPAAYRVGNGYYQDYQRGHMLASEDRQCSRDANVQTFLMSNMHPQYGRFNGSDDRGNYVWLNAESLLRSLHSSWTRAYNSTDTIYVVKGGTIDGSSNILGYTSNGGTGNIIVPRYFYMAMLYKTGRSQTHGGYKAIALWIPHREGDTTKGKDIARRYAISIDELEERTGIDFFCNLPDDIEQMVERQYSLAAWGWQ